MKKEIGP